MSSGIGSGLDNREAQHNESSSEFVCTQQDVPVNRDDLNNVFVKMDLLTKNKIIDKLHKFTETLFEESLDNGQKIALLKGIHEIVSTLNYLPVLADSKATNYFVDCEEDDAQSVVDIFALDTGRFLIMTKIN